MSMSSYNPGLTSTLFSFVIFLVELTESVIVNRLPLPTLGLLISLISLRGLMFKVLLADI